jgi:predicted alpha/beta-fold hydrolase
MTRVRLLLGIAVLALAASPAAHSTTRSQFATTVTDVLAQPYQPAYAPAGFDSAFGNANVPNTAPAEDYTSGSIPGSPDHPNWPAWFKPVQFTSTDGAPLTGYLAVHKGSHPGIVVVHGFNTNGKESIIRWAATLYANGYDVLAADQRDFKAEYDANHDYPNHWPQTFGWKESQDVVAAGRYLAAQKGVAAVGVVGFSEGAQNTILAMAQPGGDVFKAGLTFSAPADQDTQIYSTAVPPNCQTPLCTYPATDALVQLVVPPFTYNDPCAVLDDAATHYGTTAFGILAQETAFHAQTKVSAPLLNFYANDDPLVQPFQATMMAGYEGGAKLQRTVLIQKGAHAYYYDRWWQQKAILLYFKELLPSALGDASLKTDPTVNQTPGGAAMSSQLVDLGSPTRAQADLYVAPFICDTSKGKPGA